MPCTSTVTRTVSQSFGTLSDRPASAELEIRASYTPAVDAPHPLLPRPTVGAIIREHVSAWLELLALITALEPVADGVTRLERRR